MSRRIPNILLALIIGFAVALLRTPQRIRDFTDTSSQTIDALIAQDFGLTGAVVYHIVIGTVVWALLAAIPLAIFRRPPRSQAPADATAESATLQGSNGPPQALHPPGADSDVGVLSSEARPAPPTRDPNGGSSKREKLFVVYVNHPTSKARLHLASCPEYVSRKGDETENGYWTSAFATIEVAVEHAESTGKRHVDRCAICSP